MRALDTTPERIVPCPKGGLPPVREVFPLPLAAIKDVNAAAGLSSLIALQVPHGMDIQLG